MPEGVNIPSSNNKCGFTKENMDIIPVGCNHGNQHWESYEQNSHDSHGPPEINGRDSIKINLEQAKEQTVCFDFVHRDSNKNGYGNVCEHNSEYNKDNSDDLMNRKENTGVCNYVNKIKEHVNGGGNCIVVDACGDTHYKCHTWPKVNVFTPSCINKDSVEVWCLCRLVKPCGCERSDDHADRDATPTPDDDDSDIETGHDSKSPTPTPECNGVMGKSSKEGRENCQPEDVNECEIDSLVDKFKTSGDSGEQAVPRRSRRRVDLQPKSITEPTGADPTTPKMDNMSVGSFDHFDFDASLCSLKSTDMMEQGDLSDQLSLVQQLVTEMKQGFSTAMDELSKIQYGDQTLQQQLADNKRDCGEQISQIRHAVNELKTEVQQLSGQMKTVTEVQRSLQDKVDAYHTDKEILLEELEKNGAITEGVRLRLSSGHIHENNNNNNVSPMMHPYLNSLQNHHGEKGPEDMNSDSSLTAALTRSLSLTQALGEKCLHLDFSTTSSDDEETSRHSHTSSGHRRTHHRHAGHHYVDGRLGHVVPPHEQVSAEVHREEAARDMVDAEREYCSQIWSLVDDFLTPMQDAEIVSIREFQFLFPAYIPHLYEQHCGILRTLEDRLAKWRFTGIIGDVFAKLTDSQEGDGLGLYKEYIGDFPNIINGMNKWFAQSAQFREIMQSQFLASAPVLPLLLAPLQQVPKYSLLLKNLLKYTPTDHPDRYYLESSLNKLKFFLNTMNEDLEHAMQVLNISHEPLKRSRDAGSFQRRSSDSSGDMNHRPSTRDSGIHSTEEEVSKSPLTPNSQRRHVLQVLREKRERRNDHPAENSADGTPTTPRDRKHQVFGSHPDLSSHLSVAPEGRHSPHLASLPQSKMFSSLSKLPMPADRGRRGHHTNTHEAPRPLINRNYLRPLTPQVFPSSTSAHSFQEARRKEEIADRYRPASAIEFTSNRPDFHSSFLNSYRSASPGHSINSDRSRKDLHLSLQKLLLETGHDVPDGTNHDQGQYDDSESTYHKQFMAAQTRILRNGSDRDRHQYNDNSKDRNKNRFTEHAYPTHTHTNHNNGAINSPAQEDYGIYGDDDEENYEDEQEEVKPMELLPKSHRPKIMIPRWRKHTSPHPPSYRSSVEGINKPSEFMSQENLASSLAQSLLDGDSNPTSPVNENQKQNDPIVEIEPSVSKSSSLNRSPRKSDTPKWSDLSRKSEKSEDEHVVENNKNNFSNIRQHAIDSPRRPTDLQLDFSGTTVNTPTKIKNKIRKRSFEIKTNSGTKLPPADMLSDVIHYTADCIEKSDSKPRDNGSGSDSDINPDSHKSIASSGLRLSSSSHTDDSFTQLHNESSLLNGYLTTTTADFTDTVTSVSNVQTSAVNTESVSPTFSYDFATSSPTITMSSSFDTKPNFESVSSAPVTPGNSVNTDNLVYYFQKRNQQNFVSQHQTSEANSTSETQPTSTITSMLTSSTPASEQKDTQSVVTIESPTVNVAKTMGRLVRSDEKNTARNKPSAEETKTLEKQTDQTENADRHDKESVMRAVDRLRLSFEKSKQTRQQNSQNLRSPESRPIQTRLPISTNNQPPRPASETAITRKPLVLTTFSLPQKPIKTDADEAKADAGKEEQNGVDNSINGVDQPDHSHRMYKKGGSSRSPARYSDEPAATARQIQKFERSTSPTTRSGSPVAHSSQERSLSPASLTQASPFPIKPVRIGVSPPRKEVSFIPKRSRSPTRSVERPKSATGFTTSSMDMTVVSEPGATMPLKSSLKETKIPVIKKSPSTGTSHLSKSSEDISKMKKKSAFKDSLKHIFGRKKKKSKLFNNGSDYVDNYDSHVTMEMGPPFLEVDEILSFPLPRERSNSASQILQTYIFEDDGDGEVSAV